MRPVRGSHRQQGFGLIGAMVAAALLSIVALTLLTMMGNLEDATSHTNQDKAAADFTRYIRNVMTEPQVCSNALRNTAFTGAPLPADVNWTPGTTVSIDHIEIYQSAAVSLLAAQKGAMINGIATASGLTLTDIQLRSPDPALGEVPLFSPSPVTVNRAGTTYSAYPAKLVLRFAQAVGGLGGQIADKTVDLSVATTAAGLVSFCYQPQQVKNVQFLCNAHHLYPGYPDCGTLPAGFFYWYWNASAVACAPIYYIQGTDALGAPICACRLNCITPAAYGGGFVP